MLCLGTFGKEGGGSYDQQMIVCGDLLHVIEVNLSHSI